MRFPEFDGEWEKYNVSDILNTFPTNSLSWDNLSYKCGKIKNIHYGLIHNGFDTTCVYTTNKIIPFIKDGNFPLEYTLLKTGDLILADASENRKDVGRPIEIINDICENIISGLHTIHARDESNIAVQGFKGFYFQSKSMKSQIYRIANGSKIYGISPSNFKELHMCLPDHLEQEKIVVLLRKIETRIQTQSKIIEDYEELKSWITDQIFNREVSTKKLKSLIFEVNQRNKLQLALDVLTVSNKRGFIKQSEQFEERNVASEDTSNYKIVCVDQYAYNPARINVGSIARLNNYEKGIISPMYTCFEINEEKLNPIYFDLFLKSKSFKSQLNKKLEGSVRQCLIFSGMLSMEIPLPSIQTQSVIAKRISMLDSNIKIENTYLVRLKQQKKYLLDNLFI